MLLLAETRFYGEALEDVLSLRRIETASQWGWFLESPSPPDDPPPSVVVLDVAAENRPGTVRAVLRLFPSTRVVALSVRDSASEIVPVVTAGAGACVPPDGTLGDVVDAIAAVAAGRRWFTSKATGILLRSRGGPAADVAEPPLTARERQVLALVERGLSNKQIAKRLSISLPTVKNHVHHILRKMSVQSRAEAAARARGSRAGSP